MRSMAWSGSPRNCHAAAQARITAWWVSRPARQHWATPCGWAPRFDLHASAGQRHTGPYGVSENLDNPVHRMAPFLHDLVSSHGTRRRRFPGQPLPDRLGQGRHRGRQRHTGQCGSAGQFPERPRVTRPSHQDPVRDAAAQHDIMTTISNGNHGRTVPQPSGQAS